MLRLRRIEIENFVCFDGIVVEPSTDPDHPLTVIRAENGSGKTTFLRAVRWGMYGEKGLPGDPSRFSLHPAWWHPDEDGIKTQVTIEFETDGTTRFSSEGGRTTTTYQLVRSVSTIGKPSSRDDEPDFRRINEQAQLMVKEGDGRWMPHGAGADSVVEQLLPWDLRDFFVMDADEAADFVGGSENKIMSRGEVEKKTTAAVHSLLGLDVFHDASERVGKIADAFGAAATKAVGNADLDAMQAELDQLRTDRTDLNDTIGDERSQKSELDDRLRQRRDDLETKLRGIGAGDELRARLSENRRAHDRATKERSRTLGLLAGEMESPELLASLAGREIAASYEILKPLYESGHIPLKHLNFVRDLLETGTCVCGEDLATQGSHRQHVEQRIAESAEQEERANYLGQLHDAAKGLVPTAAAVSWEGRRHKYAADLAGYEDELSKIGLEKRDIDAKLDQLDEDEIQVIRDEIAALDTQLAKVARDLALHEQQLPPIDSRVDSLEKTLAQRQRNERAARDKRASQALAQLVVRILDGGYATIQGEQVGELSQRMNRLFAQMAANVSDDDFEEGQRSKATLRMIAEVGVRLGDGRPDSFEIFALNSRARAMPPIEINGASRRVLALSFVLALCSESRTHAPLIADSLLNFMSGVVRRNTLRVTSENSSQPILLLTGADLEAPTEVETVKRFGGATYTLTGQWDSIEAGEGGDVVNWTEQRQVSLICDCAPREFCSICEREGQSGSPGWAKRA